MSHFRSVLRSAALLALAVFVLWMAARAFAPAAAAYADEPASDSVGIISGDAISVHGPMNIEVARGQVKTLLRSGSDVRVNSGQARIELVEGGQIDICGPAHFSVLKSGGSLTLAIDSGIVHLHVGREPSLTIYTPQLQAKPILIGDAVEDLLIGFDASGAMCVRTSAGAVRLENQLSSQSVIVPQGSDVTVNNGRLENMPVNAGHCECDVSVAKSASPASVQAAPPPAEAMESPVKQPDRIENSAATSSAATAALPEAQSSEQPVYQIFMPPLKFDANSKEPNPIDPKLIVLVRKVRVRPTLIFEGHVEAEAPVVASATAPQPAEAPAASQVPNRPASHPSQDSVLERLRNFFHRLWSRS